MAQEDKLSINKLEGAKNWQIWKYQMTAILEARELYGHIDGTLTRPSVSESSSGAIASFEKSLKKTKALIVTSIKSDLIYLITECKTPKEIWDTLEQRFERDTIANKLFLKQRFFSLKMKESDHIDEHLRRMKVITDQLAAIKAPIPHDEHLVALLLSLPRSYNTLVTALTAKGDELTLTQLHQALLNEEEKRKQSKSKATGGGTDDGANLHCNITREIEILSSVMDVEKKVIWFEIVLRKRKNSIDEMKIKRRIINHQSIMQLLPMGTLIRVMILVLFLLLG